MSKQKSNELIEKLSGEFDEFKGEGFARLYNSLMETLYKIRMTAVESQVFWYILRRSNGFNKRFTVFSFPAFQAVTGLRKENVYRALRSLLKKNIIRCGHDNRGIKYYGLNPVCDQWCSHSVKKDTRRIKIDTGRIQNDNLPVSKMTPLLHTKGSTEISSTHISHNSNRDEKNQVDDSLHKMIQYAARTCSLTIVGEAQAVLEQLKNRHPDRRIREAMGHFALYQLEPLEGRMFPVGRSFNAFVRKFDLFVDADRVDRRLADERRWFREHVKNNIGPDGMPVSHHPPPEQDPERPAKRTIEFMLDFNRSLERGAQQRGVTVKQLLGPDQNTFNKYNLFKKRLENMRI